MWFVCGLETVAVLKFTPGGQRAAETCPAATARQFLSKKVQTNKSKKVKSVKNQKNEKNYGNYWNN